MSTKPRRPCPESRRSPPEDAEEKLPDLVRHPDTTTLDRVHSSMSTKGQEPMSEHVEKSCSTTPEGLVDEPPNSRSRRIPRDRGHPRSHIRALSRTSNPRRRATEVDVTSTRDRGNFLEIEEPSRSRVTRCELSYSDWDSLGPKIAESIRDLSTPIHMKIL